MKTSKYLCTRHPDDLIVVPRWFVESLLSTISSIPEWYNDECLDGVHDE